MKRKCDICGKEADQDLMKDIGYGRSKEWWCPECYLKSQNEATASDMYRKRKFEKMKK